MKSTPEPRPEETNYSTKTVLQGSADESERIESLKNAPGVGVREFDPDHIEDLSENIIE